MIAKENSGNPDKSPFNASLLKFELLASSIEQEAKRRSQLLQALLKIIGLGSVLLILITNLTELPDLDVVTLTIELIGLITVIICYLINRRGSSYLSAILFFFMLNLLVSVVLLTDNNIEIANDLRSIPTLLVLAVVAAGVILRPRYSFIFAGLSVVSLILITLLRVNPDIPILKTPAIALNQLDVPISLLLAMAGLSWYFESNMQNLLLRLTWQNQKLVLANEELFQKRVIEQRLTKEVDAFTSQLSEAFVNQNLSATQQLEMVTRFTATLQQLNQVAQSVAQASKQVDNTAQNALKVAQLGTENIRTSLDSIIMLNAQAQFHNSTMQELYEQAQQINHITELTNELTEEMSVLALNARIEAAGAGINARRFGAVAGEMQRLSNRSGAAATQIQEIIEKSQRAIEFSAELALNTAQEISGVIENTRTVEEILAGIVEMVKNNATLASEISQAVQEQRDSTAETVGIVHELSRIASNVSQYNQNIMSSLSQLNLTVNQLTLPLTEEA